MPSIDDALDVPVEHDRAAPNGVDLHVVAAGPDDGDPVVCLHGFPECWYTWKHQIPALAAAGYRVLAPDLRGANRTGKPKSVAAYRLAELTGDVAGLVEDLADGSARVLAHDFGGLVAWRLAATRPDLVDRLVVANAPHLAVYDRHLRSSLAQLRKSWYVFYFQLPRLPEVGLSYDDCAVIESLYREQVSPAAITDTDVERFKAAAARDGALRAMVHWYRALGRQYLSGIVRGRGPPAAGAVAVPTLLCWGENDHALSAALVDDHRDVVTDLAIDRHPDAGHWVHFDAKEAVNDAVLDFF